MKEIKESLKGIKHIKKPIKLGVFLLLGYLAQKGHAQDLSDLSLIRDKVKANPTQTYIQNYTDTVYVCKGLTEEGKELEIIRGPDFTAFYLESDKEGDRSNYAFDIRNNGIDKLINTDGPIDKMGKAFVELEGLSSPQKLEIEIHLNSIEQDIEGKTNYNTRRTYCMNPDSSTTCYNFRDNTVEHEQTSDCARNMGKIYSAMIKRSKLLLGLK